MISTFIKRMSAVYGPLDPIATKEYQRALGGYSTEALERAANWLFENHKYKSWPSIAEAVKAVKTAHRELELLKLKPARKATRKPLEEFQVERMLRSSEGRPLTQRACQEGWIVGLHDYVRDKHRLPSHKAVNKIKGNSEFVLNCSTGRVDMGIMHGGLLKLAGAMVDRRNKLIVKYAETGAVQ